MIITSLGDGTFRLQSGERNVLIDPTTARLKGDITLHTKAPLAAAANERDPQTISLPGEYEFGGIEVRGWQRGVMNGSVLTYYLVIWDDIRIAFVGEEGPLPDTSSLEELERLQPEVVLLPMKTKEQADWSAKLVKQLEPSVCIPSAYGTQKDVSAVFGKAVQGPEEKFTFKKKDLENHDQTVIVLANK